MSGLAADQTAHYAVVFDQVAVRINGVEILASVSGRVPSGACTAIVGPNGAGKTTLLLALLGEIPYEGAIRLSQPNGQRPRLGYVPQRLAIDRHLPLTVAEFLAMGQQRLPLWLGISRRTRQAICEHLAAVQAAHLAEQPIGSLSGGEQQRILIALALQNRPDILILDEPEAGVDLRGEEVFCEVLEALRKERGFTLLMVSHDLSLVTAHASHVLCLNRRLIAEGNPREILTPAVLTATFGLHRGLPDVHGLPEASGGHEKGCACRQSQGAVNACKIEGRL